MVFFHFLDSKKINNNNYSSNPKGQEGENTRPELHRINKNTYGFIVNYIRSRLGMKYGKKLAIF